jgi:hypothetical protein
MEINLITSQVPTLPLPTIPGSNFSRKPRSRGFLKQLYFFPYNSTNPDPGVFLDNFAFDIFEAKKHFPDLGKIEKFVKNFLTNFSIFDEFFSRPILLTPVPVLSGTDAHQNT